MPRKSWWARLPFGVRMAVGASAVLVVVAGGAVAVATLTGGGERAGTRIVTQAGDAEAALPEVPADGEPHAAAPLRRGTAGPARAAGETNASGPANGTGPANATGPADATGLTNGNGPNATGPANGTGEGNGTGEANATGPASAGKVAEPPPVKAGDPARPGSPGETTRTETETRAIPFETRVVRDPKLPRGAEKERTPGVPGVETLRYLVTLRDGRPVERKLIDAVVTQQPQHRVVAYGTRRGLGHRDRNCGEALNFCVPLGRGAVCPANDKDKAKDKAKAEDGGEDRDGREEDATLPDLVLDADLGYLEGVAC
ncbi:G5 domain-containing protein [Actinoplanes sp. CA-030573]|uniref:G5 domain-containing protein n=1 Tax=Actinoplanes sp. CA-030573 TaxID=3239898 RepID=UPI003D8E7C11